MIRFYFSFRSPYAWLGFHRISRLLRDRPLEIEYIPLVPPREFVEKKEISPKKQAYIAEDVKRFAAAYGLPLRWPSPFDTVWERPHAAYLYAQDRGAGPALGMAAYKTRFSEGRDISDVSVLRDLARRTGIDEERLLEATDDPLLHARLKEGAAQAQADGVFGVPFFVYRGRHYWGNDRIEWLLRDIQRDAGRGVVDLTEDPFGYPMAENS